MVRCEKIGEFIEAAYIQHYLECLGTKLVYMDEFHVNMKSTKCWNWNHRGYYVILLMDAEAWTMNFVVTYSKFKIEDIMITSTLIEMHTFIWFLGDIWNSLMKSCGDDQLICIIDNSTVYTNKITEKLIIKDGFCWVTISPLSTQLNAVENSLYYSRVNWEENRQPLSHWAEISWRRSWMVLLRKLKKINYFQQNSSI